MYPSSGRPAMKHDWYGRSLFPIPSSLIMRTGVLGIRTWLVDPTLGKDDGVFVSGCSAERREIPSVTVREEPHVGTNSSLPSIVKKLSRMYVMRRQLDGVDVLIAAKLETAQARRQTLL